MPRIDSFIIQVVMLCFMGSNFYSTCILVSRAYRKSLRIFSSIQLDQMIFGVDRYIKSLKIVSLHEKF